MKEDVLAFLQHAYVDAPDAPAREAVEYLRKTSDTALAKLLGDRHWSAGDAGSQVRRRNSFDALLTFYSLVEVGCLTGVIGPLPKTFRADSRRLLRHPRVSAYYQIHRPQLLPQLLLRRSEGFPQWTDLTRSSEEFYRLCRISALVEGTGDGVSDVDAFCGLIDRGRSGNISIDDFTRALGDPRRVARALEICNSDADPDDIGWLDSIINGFDTVVMFSLEFDIFLHSVDDDVARSCYWHVHGNRFELLKYALHSALEAASKALGPNALADDARSAITRLTSGRYGVRLHELAFTDALAEVPVAAVVLPVAALQAEAPQEMEVPQEIEAPKELDRVHRQMLDLSEFVSSQTMFKKRVSDARALVRGAVDTVRPAAEAKGISLETSPSEEPVIMLADPAGFQHVVLNLLSNAVKFTSPGGQVRVRVQSDPSHVTLVVEDTGVGITRDLLPRIFEPFQEGSKIQSKKPGGTGLGLAVAKEIVEMHGGTISVNSEGQGRGSVFEVKLPRG